MTIYDIAEACGVSIATVSRVLNGSSKVSPKTREKVLAAMNEQNYTPNPFARGLGLNSMKMIGILCTDVSDAYFAKAVSLVERDLRKRGLDVILGCTGMELSNKKKYLQLLLDKHVDAIILIGSPFREESDNSHILAAAKQIPIITINGLIEMPNIYSIICDEKNGVFHSVELLANEGYHSILYLYDSLTYSGKQKLEGYRQAVEKCGLDTNPKLIQRITRTLEDAEAIVEQLINEKIRFSAIVASEDLLAVGAQKGLISLNKSKHKRKHVPVIGCNNSILAECSTPSLTSMDNRLEVLCPAAIDTLTKILAGEGASIPSKAIFPSILVPRDSYQPENKKHE
jgi:LacI family transcriptional regulator